MKDCYQHTDLKWRLSQIPDGAACRGLFFNMLDERAAEFGPEIQQEYRNYFKIHKFQAFKLYSVKDYLTRMVKLSQLKFGGPNIHRGLWELQYASWPAWRKTLMGRATVGLLGKDFQAILKMCKTTVSMSINYGSFEVEGGPSRFLLTHKNEYVYIEHAMAGGIHGIAFICDLEINLSPKLIDPFNGTLEVEVLSKRKVA
jgi:uncharacterized protein (TIGR02265 family)